MNNNKKYDQVIEQLVKRLAETKQNQVSMEEAVKSAEMLCIKFSNDLRAQDEAVKIKQSCESALESIKVQIDLLTQIIETMKNETDDENI